MLRAPSMLECTLSVVVPVRNEAPNLLPLIGEIRAALADIGHEVLYVDDGSTDDTPLILATAGVRVLRHRHGSGQSAALITGIRAASGLWIATLDGDGQNDPADIPSLLAAARAADPAHPVLVGGHRQRRADRWVRRITSRIANRVRASLLGDHTADSGCGLKLFRREDFLDLPHFDHMHRFLPALFLRAGGHVISLPVHHRPRLAGTSKYGTLDRLAVGLVDLLGVRWLQARAIRPELVDDADD